MRLYDNALSSRYEELKTFYPVWYRDVLEMDALWRVFGNRLDEVQAGIVQAIGNCYINTADEEAIKKLEDFLYVTYDGPRTLPERRALVASFFIGNGHIGEKEIKELMAGFTNGEISVALVGGTVEISVSREISDRFNLADSTYVILKRIPAHLGLSFSDVLLPITLTNKEQFWLRKFRAATSVYNGIFAPPIFLDGRRKLDGAWDLSHLWRWLRMPGISFALAFTSQEAATAASIAFSAMGIANASGARFDAFTVRVAAVGKAAVAFDSAAFGLSVRQPQRFSGTITIDNMYRLDGAVNLDGSRKLNAEIIKEDI